MPVTVSAVPHDDDAQSACCSLDCLVFVTSVSVHLHVTKV